MNNEQIARESAKQIWEAIEHNSYFRDVKDNMESIILSAIEHSHRKHGVDYSRCEGCGDSIPGIIRTKTGGLIHEMCMKDAQPKHGSGQQKTRSSERVT